MQVADSFFLLIALAGFLDETGTAYLFFAAALLHELGHALAVLLCGGQLVSLRLTGIGGVMRYRLRAGSVWRDICIAAAGPLIGFLVAWCASVLGGYQFAGANLLLSLFNLLPVRPLDGGQMVSALLRGSQTQTVLEFAACAFLGIWAIWVIFQGGGFSLLILMGVLVANLQKNLQINRNGYTI